MPALGPGFAWESEADPNANDLTQVEPSLRDLIRATVEEGYTAKGYTKATPQQASFLLRGKVASSKQGDTASDSFEQYTEGTLVIYMLNPQTGNWIWRGWAKARLQEANSPEQKRERLRQAVQMMLKEVPAVRVSSGR